jgi:hypothetical protein
LVYSEPTHVGFGANSPSISGRWTVISDPLPTFGADRRKLGAHVSFYLVERVSVATAIAGL